MSTALFASSSSSVPVFTVSDLKTLETDDQQQVYALVTTKHGVELTSIPMMIKEDVFHKQCAKTSASSAQNLAIKKKASLQLDPFTLIPKDVDLTFLDFPYVVSSKTVKHVLNSQVMFIMRGLPGSGKSTIVRSLKALYGNDATVCSADHFFYNDDGEYKFDERLLAAAHSSCQQKAKEVCSKGSPVVIIDNTNVKRWEMKFYLQQANICGYVVIFVEPKTPWKFNANELFKKNHHDVPLEVLRKKVLAFDDVLPVYYGWFINMKMSKKLTSLCSSIFMQCLKVFPGLKSELLQELHVQASHVDDETAMGILKEYFSHSERSSPLLHCTSKFCCFGKVTGSSNYHKRRDVQAACGDNFSLVITAILITKRTLSLRVALGENMLPLFDKPEELDWGKGLRGFYSHTSVLSAGDARRGCDDDRIEDDFEEVLSKRDRKKLKKASKKGTINNPEEKILERSNKKGNKKSPKNSKKGQNKNDAITDENNDNIHVLNSSQSSFEECNSIEDMFPSKFQNDSYITNLFPHIKTCGSGRSGHCTVKTARGVESKETNFDILQLCDIESSKSHDSSNFQSLNRGKARYYGDGFCCVYFDKPLKVNALFSGYY